MKTFSTIPGKIILFGVECAALVLVPFYEADDRKILGQVLKLGVALGCGVLGTGLNLSAQGFFRDFFHSFCWGGAIVWANDIVLGLLIMPIVKISIAIEGIRERRLGNKAIVTRHRRTAVFKLLAGC
jgi:hypothetical protein